MGWPIASGRPVGRSWPGKPCMGLCSISFYTLLVRGVHRAYRGGIRLEPRADLHRPFGHHHDRGDSYPVLGWVVDKLGPRRVGLPGAIAFALTYGLLGLTTDNIWTWWGIWFLLSFTIIGIKPLVWTTAVASTFQRNRGLALAIALCGGGFASAFGPSPRPGQSTSSAGAQPIRSWRCRWAWSSSRSCYFRAAQRGGQGEAAQYRPVRPRSKSARFMAWDGRRRCFPGSSPSWPRPPSCSLSRPSASFPTCCRSWSRSISAGPRLPPSPESRASPRSSGGSSPAVCSTGSIPMWSPRIVVLIPVASCLLLLAAIPAALPSPFVAVAIIGVSLGSEVDVMAFMTARQFGTRAYGTDIRRDLGPVGRSPRALARRSPTASTMSPAAMNWRWNWRFRCSC